MSIFNHAKSYCFNVLYIFSIQSRSKQEEEVVQVDVAETTFSASKS